MSYLVISRKISERIKIGDDIEILISDLRKTDSGELKADIAIKAPKQIKIQRLKSHLEEQKSESKSRNKSR